MDQEKTQYLTYAETGEAIGFGNAENASNLLDTRADIRSFMSGVEQSKNLVGVRAYFTEKSTGNEYVLIGIGRAEENGELNPNHTLAYFTTRI